MSEHSNWKPTVAVAAIGALGSIVAAVVPIYLTRKSDTPAPAPVQAPTVAPAPAPAPQSPPALVKHAPSDEERVQGSWRVVFQANRGNVVAKDQVRERRIGWRFSGTTLKVTVGDGATKKVPPNGTFSLRTQGGRKLFEFKDERFEWVGIYEFEGTEVLKICYRVRRTGTADPPPEPPTSFDPDESVTSVWLRRGAWE